jgi:L-alanine-DL-glutamate epimerase-like enolase superfamily enzyme
MNVAPHNFYSPLSTAMSAHFAASIPNLRIMEIDPDVVPWYYDLVTVPPTIQTAISPCRRPRLGHRVNEEAVRAHPFRGSRNSVV